jgi:hypothetical protein
MLCYVTLRYVNVITHHNGIDFSANSTSFLEARVRQLKLTTLLLLLKLILRGVYLQFLILLYGKMFNQ